MLSHLSVKHASLSLRSGLFLGCTKGLPGQKETPMTPIKPQIVAQTKKIQHFNN